MALYNMTSTQPLRKGRFMYIDGKLQIAKAIHIQICKGEGLAILHKLSFYPWASPRVTETEYSLPLR